MSELSKRLGQFSVSRDVLENASIEELSLLFEGVVVVRAELMYHTVGVDYLAFSPKFEVCAEGVAPPIYRVEPVTERIDIGNGECSYHVVDFKFIKEL
jgi:hypothetical protein